MPGRLGRWMSDHYGSRRGFLRTWWHRLLFRVGRYRAYGKIDWDSVERLVFVCKGNVCRSAYAEAVARSLGVEAGSCGIEAGNGVPAYADALRVASQRGISLAAHKTTPFRRMCLKESDLLIAMEPWQVEHLEHALGDQYQCTLLGMWGSTVSPYIHDPYGASAGYFERCFDQIDESVNEVIQKVGKTDRH